MLDGFLQRVGGYFRRDSGLIVPDHELWERERRRLFALDSSMVRRREVATLPLVDLVSAPLYIPNALTWNNRAKRLDLEHVPGVGMVYVGHDESGYKEGFHPITGRPAHQLEPSDPFHKPLPAPPPRLPREERLAARTQWRRDMQERFRQEEDRRRAQRMLVGRSALDVPADILASMGGLDSDGDS